MIKQARHACAGKPEASAVEKALHYFVSNVSRMQYGTFRAADFCIGSGVVEAGGTTVIGARCKQSGNVLVRIGRRKYPALALHPQQPSPRRILETPSQHPRGPKRWPPPGRLTEKFCLTPSEKIPKGQRSFALSGSSRGRRRPPARLASPLPPAGRRPSLAQDSDPRDGPNPSRISGALIAHRNRRNAVMPIAIKF